MGGILMETAYTQKTTGMLEAFPWWLVLVQGIITLILGIFLLYSPVETVFVMVTFLGAYWFVSGIIAIASIFGDRTNMGWKLFLGVLGIFAGLLILMYPFYSTVFIPTFLIFIIGFWGIVIGGVNLYLAFTGGGASAAAIGIIAIIFGVILLAQPLTSLRALVFILGIFAVISGIALMVMSFKLKGGVVPA